MPIPILPPPSHQKSTRKPKPKPKSSLKQLILPPIPPLFTLQKSTILASLSTPLSTYTDLSPKGSLDAPIRELIDSINQLQGVVTTSSCSGRIAVFVEGRKAPSKSTLSLPPGSGSGAGSGAVSTSTEGASNLSAGDGLRKLVPGGKGPGGYWLFVSHEPLPTPLTIPAELHPLLFTTTSSSTTSTTPSSNSPLPHPTADPASNPISTPRLIHILFEPLILHLRCASLQHAKPLLALALDSGFRESGVQSLKCLDLNGGGGGGRVGGGGAEVKGEGKGEGKREGKGERNGGGGNVAFPMVAIRSAGLGFGSVVAYLDEPSFTTSSHHGDSHGDSRGDSRGEEGGDGDGDGDGARVVNEGEGEGEGEGIIRSLVTPEVLMFLLGIANGRFVENTARTGRFAGGVAGLVEREREIRTRMQGGGLDGGGWEDRDVRAQRLRREGLAARDSVRERDGQDGGDDYELGLDFVDSSVDLV